MGRLAVRQALETFLKNGNVPFVGTVFRARPIIVSEEDYDAQMVNTYLLQNPGLDDEGSSAVVVINLPDSHRERKTLSGRANVDDTDVHDVVLELFFWSRSGDGIRAQDDHDAMCDSLVTLLRGDATLGKPSVVWSAGEFQPGVHIQQHESWTPNDGTGIIIVASCRFQTWEWLAGPAGTT
jgi:hypothetical protein